jgi:hypothetical protein
MRAWPMRRVGAFSAVAFIVVNIVAFAIPGSPPKYAAAPSKITSYYQDNHKAILVSAVLIGIGLLLLVAVVAQLADMLRTAGFPDAGFAVGVAGAATIAILGAGISIYGATAQLAMSGTEPGTIRAFYRVAQFIFTVPLAWVALGLVVPVTRVALAGVLPRWVPALNGLIAVLLVLGGISVRGDGVLAVGTGVFSWLATLALIVYFLELALLLWRSAPAATTAVHPAATPV